MHGCQAIARRVRPILENRILVSGPDGKAKRMATRRVAMILPGLGRVQRGAETAFLEVARALGRDPEWDVTVFGSGDQGTDGLSLQRVGCVPRERFERWPKFPCLRTDNHYEELSFVMSMVRRRTYHPENFDAVIACSYPYVNWMLQLTGGKHRPKQIFVTQNGDWMCQASSREYRLFHCDGLVCINPIYFERHRDSYPSALIPNGVDPDDYRPSVPGEDAHVLGIPRDRPVVLMVSAFIPAKKVAEAIRAVALVPELFLVVAGDGPERRDITSLAAMLLPGRHLLLGSLPRSSMPSIYRQADIFLHMHRDEPFGIVYLEAAASGLAIVAPDAPIPRWILGESAVYVEPDKPDSVAEGLRLALHSESRQRLGTSVRTRVLADWTWDVQARRYRDFIEQIVTESAVRL